MNIEADVHFEHVCMDIQVNFADDDFAPEPGGPGLF